MLLEGKNLQPQSQVFATNRKKLQANICCAGTQPFQQNWVKQILQGTMAHITCPTLVSW